MAEPRLTYSGAGVDIGAGEEAVERIKASVRSTFRSEVVGDVGGFAGMFAIDPGRWRRPLLVSSTDGVGTKAMVASAAGRYSTVGIDLVAMCVDDLVCSGAEPLFFLDYLAVGKLDPAQAAQLVEGVAEGCRQAGCSLVGGEMAEHPGAVEEGAFDLAGFAVGVVEHDSVLGPDRVRPGDVLVGIGSPGLRSNGYSLARRALLEVAGRDLEGPAWDGAGHTLADELLLPSVIYAPAVLSLLGRVEVHAAAHVTGGGVPGNLTRVLPDGCEAAVRPAWAVPRIFSEVAAAGRVPAEEMQRVFNLGIGMILVVAPGSAAAAVDALVGAGLVAGVVGEVSAGARRVRMEGW